MTELKSLPRSAGDSPMTTERDSAMTLEQVRDEMKSMTVTASMEFYTQQRWPDAIDAHLATRNDSGEAVAYCEPDNPFKESAFAWPGAERDELRHTMPLYALQSLASRKVDSPEDRFEQYVGTLIKHSADIQRLGEWLGKRLDEDEDKREYKFGDHYDDGYSNGYSNGWNACREAILALHMRLP